MPARSHPTATLGVPPAGFVPGAALSLGWGEATVATQAVQENALGTPHRGHKSIAVGCRKPQGMATVAQQRVRAALRRGGLGQGLGALLEP